MNLKKNLHIITALMKKKGWSFFSDSKDELFPFKAVRRFDQLWVRGITMDDVIYRSYRAHQLNRPPSTINGWSICDVCDGDRFTEDSSVCGRCKGRGRIWSSRISNDITDLIKSAEMMKKRQSSKADNNKKKG